jgi:hypothetical protein
MTQNNARKIKTYETYSFFEYKKNSCNHMNIQIANYAIAMSSVLTWEVCGHPEKLWRLGPQAAVPLHDMVPYTRSGPWSTQRSLHSVRFFSQLRGTCCPLFSQHFSLIVHLLVLQVEFIYMTSKYKRIKRIEMVPNITLHGAKKNSTKNQNQNR